MKPPERPGRDRKTRERERQRSITHWLLVAVLFLVVAIALRATQIWLA